MTKKNKILFFTVFIGIIIFTGYGILELANQGGPCNGGIALVFLAPILIICVSLLIISFSWLTFDLKANYNIPIWCTLISLVIWTFASLVFLDDGISGLIYLGLLELLNIFLLLFFIKQSNKKQQLIKSVMNK